MFAAVSCNLDRDILLSTLPLFQSSEIEGIEWSFDALYNHKNIPPWFVELLDAYGEEGRLIGHGVFFSIFSARLSDEQIKWLEDLRKKSDRFNFAHITEHFGFMTGENFHSGAPISMPYTKRTLAIGQDRLMRVANACQKPVGLENLALAYSTEDIKIQGEFIFQLLKPVNGFMILDLHNLYCQCHNFNIEFEELMGFYNLELVREIHISGGSWADSLIPSKKIRRDTHDDRVPIEVYKMLEHTIPLCQNLKFVVLEQIGNSLHQEESQQIFRDDFLKMKEVMNIIGKTNTNTQVSSFLNTQLDNGLKSPLEDSALYSDQIALSKILESSFDLPDAKRQLKNSSLANSSWRIEKWEDHMLDTALRIAQKWK